MDVADLSNHVLDLGCYVSFINEKYFVFCMIASSEGKENILSLCDAKIFLIMGNCCAFFSLLNI